MARRKKNSIRVISKPLHRWISYMDRLASEPRGRTQVGLLSVLNAAYTQTQINVHVLSGNLRKSGRSNASLIKLPGHVQWEGEIGYGMGIRYAKYEMGDRRRGSRPDWLVHPSHDPYDGLETYYEAVDAVLDTLGKA